MDIATDQTTVQIGGSVRFAQVEHAWRHGLAGSTAWA
jgi:hypothetical protein